MSVLICKICCSFKKSCVARTEASQIFNNWVNSNDQDESRLLRGQALQDALSWASNKNLSSLDYRFLSASQDLEKQTIWKLLDVEKNIGVKLT